MKETTMDDDRRAKKSAYDKARYEKKRDEILAKNRARYYNNKPNVSAKGKEYRSKNSAELKEKRRERYLRDRKKLIAKAIEWRRRNPEKAILISSRCRARNLGLEFNLTIDDISIPTKCPVLGIALDPMAGPRADHLPSLDRVDPTLGYVRGNVRVISWRANNIKGDASIGELVALGEYVLDHASNFRAEGCAK